MRISSPQVSLCLP